MKTLRITVNGTPYDVQVEEVSGGAAPAVPAAAPAPKAAPAAAATKPASAPAAPAAETKASEAPKACLLYTSRCV